MNRDVPHAVSGGGSASRRRFGAARIALVATCALLALPALASGADPVFSGSFDGSATPAGSMVPERMAVDEASGRLYVIDSAHDVVDVFDADGAYVTQLAGSSTTNGTFGFGAEPDIAIDNSGGPNAGNVYVNGETAGLIYAFDADGDFLWQSAANITDTCGVAVDPDGNPWYADYTNGLQQLAADDGSPVGDFLLAGTESCHFAFKSTGGILLTHYLRQVDEYAPDGDFVRNYDPLTPSDVAVESSSDFVYTDRQVEIAIWDELGQPVGAGFAPANLNSLGVAVDGSAAKIYVSDTVQGIVSIFDGTVRHRLVVTPGGSDSGAVSADAGAIVDCSTLGGTCMDVYDDGATVTLTATPGAGDVVRWSGCDAIAGDDCTLTLNASANVTATFGPPTRHTLTVAKGGSGGGTVTSAPAGIACGAACSAAFEEGRAITLTAAPAADATFSGWSGGGCAGTGACRVTLNGDVTVRATFAQNPPRSCATDPALCPPPPRTCATDASLCPPPPARTCATDAALCPPPPARGTPGVLKLDASSATLSGTAAAVKLSCAGDTACSFTVKLTAKLTVGRGRRRHKATVVIATKRVSVAAGQAASVRLTLSKAARTLLAARRSLSATLTAGALRRTLTVKAPRRARRLPGY